MKGTICCFFWPKNTAYYYLVRQVSRTKKKLLLHYYEHDLPINDRVVRDTKTIDTGLIPGRVKPNTTKIGILGFHAKRSAIRGTV